MYLTKKDETFAKRCVVRPLRTIMVILCVRLITTFER